MQPCRNSDVKKMLVESDKLVPRGGSELSHFCWIDCEHVLFVGCSGHLVGLLNFSNNLETVTGRYAFISELKKKIFNVLLSLSSIVNFREFHCVRRKLVGLRKHEVILLFEIPRLRYSFISLVQ